MRRILYYGGLGYADLGTVLYVIILSAALDLVPPETPKGIIAFCNIAPALAAKVGWPYILKGRIRYVRRLVGCCVVSVFGMLVRCCPPTFMILDNNHFIPGGSSL